MGNASAPPSQQLRNSIILANPSKCIFPGLLLHGSLKIDILVLSAKYFHQGYCYNWIDFNLLQELLADKLMKWTNNCPEIDTFNYKCWLCIIIWWTVIEQVTKTPLFELASRDKIMPGMPAGNAWNPTEGIHREYLEYPCCDSWGVFLQSVCQRQNLTMQRLSVCDFCQSVLILKWESN